MQILEYIKKHIQFESNKY